MATITELQENDRLIDSRQTINTNFTNLNTAKAEKATTLEGYGITNAYNKTTMDEKLAEAGKVKTVNGASPDASGNIAITVGGHEIVDELPSVAEAEEHTVYFLEEENDTTATYTKGDIDTITGNINVQLTALSDGKLNLTGGTLTGSLILKSADGESITQQGWRTVSFYDKNNLIVSEIKGGIGTTGNNYISLSSADGSGNLNECLGVRFNKSTSAHETFATTPATSDNSTKIATTAFVNNKIVAGSRVSVSGSIGFGAYYNIVGNVVIVYIEGVPTSDITTHDTVLVTNLPQAKNDMIFYMPCLTSGVAACRAKITGTNIKLHYGKALKSSSYGCVFCYAKA